MVTNDLTGQKFGRITFLKRSDKKQGTSYYWEGVCDCGKSVCIVPSKAVHGTTISCGCYVKDVAKKRLNDWTGQKFGRITFLRRATTTHHAYQWEGVCDCGNPVLLELSPLACWAAANLLVRLSRLSQELNPFTMAMDKSATKQYEQDFLHLSYKLLSLLTK